MTLSSCFNIFSIVVVVVVLFHLILLSLLFFYFLLVFFGRRWEGDKFIFTWLLFLYKKNNKKEKQKEKTNQEKKLNIIKKLIYPLMRLIKLLKKNKAPKRIKKYIEREWVNYLIFNRLSFFELLFYFKTT